MGPFRKVYRLVYWTKLHKALSQGEIVIGGESSRNSLPDISRLLEVRFKLYEVRFFYLWSLKAKHRPSQLIGVDKIDY